MSIRIFLADDHAVVRDGLRFLLEAQPDFTVVGDAANGREAVHRAIQHRPDVVIMDIGMPEMNGTEATRQIRQTCPATQVVILSMHATAEHIFQSLQAGARGYLLKESAGAEVVAAVRAVHAGRRYLSQAISETVVEDYLRQHQPSDLEDPLTRLSRREREILPLVADGKSSAQIARIMPQLSILIADDHAMVREGLREWLGGAVPGCRLLEADNGDEAVSLAGAQLPDVIVMDIKMAPLDGVEATRRIKAAHPLIKVFIHTNYVESVYRQAALEAGADGFVAKGSVDDDLVTVICRQLPLALLPDRLRNKSSPETGSEAEDGTIYVLNNKN